MHRHHSTLVGRGPVQFEIKLERKFTPREYCLTGWKIAVMERGGLMIKKSHQKISPVQE